MRFYLTGQASFGNRGCEAIVRSTVQMLADEFGSDLEVLVPSVDIAADQRQWPSAGDYGVRFVPAFKSPHNKYWRHLQRLPIPALKQAGWPFPLSDGLKQQLKGADAVLSIGGDNYSLDYLIPSLLVGQDAFAMKHGVPVALWGASVGPFDSEPHYVPFIRQHLARMHFIGARESATVNYLEQSLNLENVTRVADPAFTLNPETVELDDFWPNGADGVLGLNISPLIERYRPSGEKPGILIDEVAGFIDWVTSNTGLGVLLIPHVVPFGGVTKNNDAYYMQGLLERTGDRNGRVRMMPPLNAAQSKYVLSRCRFFIGARTHATIGSLSSCVPTLSIAYSVKAKGINQDLFGHTDYVLETPAVSTDSLRIGLENLVSNEAEARRTLEEALPRTRTSALRSASVLHSTLEG